MPQKKVAKPKPKAKAKAKVTAKPQAKAKAKAKPRVEADDELPSDLDAPTYEGSCFCGAVEVTAIGAPAAMGYCHCASCRSWSASPINAFTLWKPGSILVTKGKANVGDYSRSATTRRAHCKVCGGGLKTVHPLWGLDGVYAAVIKGFEFQPGLHVNYQESVLKVRDGLPKFRDLPADFGGSGEMMAED